MNSRTLVNLLLFSFLLISLGWFIYKKNKPVEIIRLSSLQLEDINEIHIPKTNGTPIIFRKTLSKNNKHTWHMLSPYQIKAHQFRINTLLSLTQTPVDKFYSATEINLPDYALDNPRASILFNDTTISFGKSNPLNSKRYILSENKMALILDQSYPLVSAQAATFVDLKLLPDNGVINSIKLPDLNLNKTLEGSWNVDPNKKISAEQIQNLIQSWQSAQAFSVHRFLQRKQLGEIKIQTDKKVISFIISDDAPWLILARPDLGIEYHLDKSFNEKLIRLFKAGESDA